MRRPAAMLVTTSLAAGVLAFATPGVGAAAGTAQSASAGQSASAAPSASTVRSSSATRTLAARVARAFRHSTAKVVDWRFDVTGVGRLRHGAGRMTAPASNNKLLLAQTALDRLGSGYQFVTPVGARGRISGHQLTGWLVVRGSGDPLLNDDNLVDLAKQIRAGGIRRVTGGLIVDDSRYAHRTTAPGWHARFTPDETGPIDAFSVDGNEWSTSRSYIAHTGVANGQRFVHILRKHGVRITPKVRLGSYDAAPTNVIASEYSSPLSSVIDYTLLNSYNFAAEMLLDELGAEVAGSGGRTAGLGVVRAEATRLAVPLGKVYDGSGLSYADRESPDVLVEWLEHTAATQTGSELRGALPVACESGTLQHRLCGRYTTGRVAAKTGTLNHVTALSGYLTTRSGRAVTFSVLLSKVHNLSKGEAAVDRAVTAVAGYGR